MYAKCSRNISMIFYYLSDFCWQVHIYFKVRFLKPNYHQSCCMIRVCRRLVIPCVSVSVFLLCLCLSFCCVSVIFSPSLEISPLQIEIWMKHQRELTNYHSIAAAPFFAKAPPYFDHVITIWSKPCYPSLSINLICSFFSLNLHINLRRHFFILSNKYTLISHTRFYH